MISRALHILGNVIQRKARVLFQLGCIAGILMRELKRDIPGTSSAGAISLPSVDE